jgi:hypothetical protein
MWVPPPRAAAPPPPPVEDLQAIEARMIAARARRRIVR